MRFQVSGRKKKLGLGLGVGWFRVRWPGMRFRFGCWHVKLGFMARKEIRFRVRVRWV